MTISQTGLIQVVIYINYIDKGEPILETIYYYINQNSTYTISEFSSRKKKSG